MRSEQTGVPPPVWRSSGSFVRFPTRTTRLMFAAMVSCSSPTGRPRLLRCLVAVIGGSGRGRGGRRRGRLSGRLLVGRPLHASVRTVTHDAVGDLQHARDLVERLDGAREEEEVVDRLALVRDLVREPPATPRLVAVPLAFGAVDCVAD